MLSKMTSQLQIFVCYKGIYSICLPSYNSSKDLEHFGIPSADEHNLHLIGDRSYRWSCLLYDSLSDNFLGIDLCDLFHMPAESEASSSESEFEAE